jgi:hypothetical protein
LNECVEIRGAHDRRVERAVRAVTMLREKFDWKQRVEVEVEEPEELDWDPRARRTQAGSEETGDAAVIEATRLDVTMGSGSEDEDDEDKMGSSDEDEVNVEGVLVNGDASTPPLLVVGPGSESMT